jgi:hypothetical protein
MPESAGDNQALRQILEVTRKLAAPFDLDTMLAEVVDASREILNADLPTSIIFAFRPTRVLSANPLRREKLSMCPTATQTNDLTGLSTNRPAIAHAAC